MNRASVLIVDDDPIGRSSYAALLARDEYEIATASDGPSAIRLAHELRPDVILLDVMMPGMDGFEVTRRLRATPELAEIPILILTALDDPKSRITALEAGADDFVSKPIDRIEFRARLRSITRLNRYRRLTEQRERYQRLFDRSPCGLMVLAADGLVREANPVAAQLLERWLGAPPHDVRALLPDDTIDRFAQLMATASDPTNRARDEFEGRAGRKPIWFELSVSRLSADADAYLAALTDRTAERKLEAELHQSQKLESIGQLAGGIAHDFNNLLTVINGFTAMTLEALAPSDPNRDALEQVCKAGDQAAALTRQLLAFGRRAIVAPTHLNLSTVVSDVEKLLRRLIGEHIAMCVTDRSPTGVVWADPTQIEQILLNLAANARDAMPSGGQFAIELSEVAEHESGSERRWLRLTVSDTGCGMPPEVSAHIFEPFFTTKPLGKGTGLGLATVYGIVRQCDGRIRVESAVGHGTTFTVDFPRLDAPPARPRAVAKEKYARGTETVLLAEDEDLVRAFAEAALTASGYTVLVAADGEEALAKAAAHAGPIHLLFTDAVMPRLGGRGLAERLLQVRPEVKILGTSGYDDEAITRHAAPTATAAFVPKPYTALRLLRAVREVLDT